IVLATGFLLISIATLGLSQRGRLLARTVATFGTVLAHYVVWPIACLQFRAKVQSTGACFMKRVTKYAHKIPGTIGCVSKVAKLFGTLEVRYNGAFIFGHRGTIAVNGGVIFVIIAQGNCRCGAQ